VRAYNFEVVGVSSRNFTMWCATRQAW